MESWNSAFRRGLVGGATSSLLSTAALALLGRRETGSAYTSTNAVSHWIYGDEALREFAPSVRHTVPGFEVQLSRPSLAVVYGAFGIGLALGAMVCRRAVRDGEGAAR
jgi:hypothetical protein